MLKDLEELEGNKFQKYCDACEFKEYGIKGEWCFKYECPPIKKCPNFRLKRSIKEAIEITGLTTKFPNLEK